MSSQPYEIRVEPDEGWHLSTGERWRGYRVRYRGLGSRGRWSRFLLVDQDERPSLEQLQAACEKHQSSAVA